MITDHAETKKKYEEFLNSFGLKAPNNIDEIVDYDGGINLIDAAEYKMTPSRQTAITTYLKTCEEFGMAPAKGLSKLTVCEIWDSTFKNINIEITKRFSLQLSTIKNKISRKHVKDAIAVLFDQENYITKEEVDKLVAVCDDNDKLVEVYEALGGEPGCFTPSIYDCEDEEEEGVDIYEYEED